MKENIKVAIRIRPQEKRSTAKGGSRIVVNEKDNKIQYKLDGKSDKNFSYDYVFGSNVNQMQFYERIGMPKLVDNLLKGFNATVFAYGPTGSGKTYTMQGIVSQGIKTKDEGNQGLIPRTLTNLFQAIESKKKSEDSQGISFMVSVNSIQLYNEKLYDMMTTKQLVQRKLRWNSRDQFVVQGIKTVSVDNAKDAIITYGSCTKNLIFASHRLNATSSRSHSIFFINVEGFNQDNLRVFSSKLTMVDLAGSEKTFSISDNSNIKEESININRSLFYLRKVISSLSAGKPSAHVPFRDSKLTCLLKTSLGGKGSCLMVGCIHTKDEIIEDNLATLNYAYKAASITNKLIRNDDPGIGIISKLRKQIVNLEGELTKAHTHIEMLNTLLEGNVKPPGNGLENTPQKNSGSNDQVFFDKVYSKLDDIKHRNDQSREQRHQRSVRGSNEMLAARFLQTMTLVKELLVGNQELRNQLTESNNHLSEAEREKIAILAENQDLHEKIDKKMGSIHQDDPRFMTVRERKTLQNSIELSQHKSYRQQTNTTTSYRSKAGVRIKNSQGSKKSRNPIKPQQIIRHSRKKGDYSRSISMGRSSEKSWRTQNHDVLRSDNRTLKTRGLSREKKQSKKLDKIRSLNAMDIFTFN